MDIHPRKGKYHTDRCKCCRRRPNGNTRKVPLFILRAETFGKMVPYIPMHVRTDFLNGGIILIVGRPLPGLNKFKKFQIQKNAVNKHFNIY